MATYKLGRADDKKAQKRLFLSIFGSIIILGLLAVFGLKILISFSLLIDKLRGTNNQPTQVTKQIILPPILSSPYEATNSANVQIAASGEARLTLVIYINEVEIKRQIMPSEGILSLTLPVQEGNNTISAKLTDGKGNISDLSNILKIKIKKTAPLLDISSPVDNANITGEKNTINIQGKTDEDMNVKVNDRLVVVANDGSFNFPYQLNEGTNTLTITATDQSGNQTTIIRRVSYQK